MIHLFKLTKLVETCAQKYKFITPGTFAGILPNIWNKNQGMTRYLRGPSMETDFRNLVKHLHRLEGFKKLANMILGTFRGVISI